MRIGIDVDGVLADFVPAFQRTLINVSGRNLFLPGDETAPPRWDWFVLRGYSPTECEAAWRAIEGSTLFWRGLDPLLSVGLLRNRYSWLDYKHDLYFVTNRGGETAKQQTEDWLMEHLYTHRRPTVLIVGRGVKGDACKLLRLDTYIDDNYDNCVDCCRVSPTTRAHLLTKSYNIGHEIGRVKMVEDMRVGTFTDFLIAEGLVDATIGQPC